MLAEVAILLFDDFTVATHDFRAFTDYAGAFRRSVRVIATADVDFAKIAIEILGRERADSTGSLPGDPAPRAP